MVSEIDPCGARLVRNIEDSWGPLLISTDIWGHNWIGPGNYADYRGILRIPTGRCPKSRFWAVICMGHALPPDKPSLSPVEALARENPAQLMAQLRAFWPQVQEALKAGHTLRLIHERLNMAGVPISYKLLSLYRGRIERRKKGPAPSASPTTPLPARSPDSTPPVFDPMANFRAQEQKRKDWQYPSGPPDESKLI
jgi:hypothetical protein